MDRKITLSETELRQIHSVVQRPADFMAFWDETLAELALVPLEWERIPDPAQTTEHVSVDWVRFPSFDGMEIYGWLATPHAPVSPDRRAGYLWLPGYSLGNPAPGPESLYPGTITLGLNLHGNPPDTPYVHPSSVGKDYITEGIDSPYTYIFRRIVCHCLRALDVLAAQPEVDPARLIIGGMSQGGGLALITAALSRRVVACLADMPWLCDLDRSLALIDRKRYDPAKGLTAPDRRVLVLEYAEAHREKRDQIYKTYRYFDPLTHASNIIAPTQVSAGGRDPSCKPPTIFAVYNEIAAPKDILYLPNRGHEIVPELHAAHLNWLNKWL